MGEERWSQYYERFERLKESLSRGEGRIVERKRRQDPGAIVVGIPEWVFYEKIADQPKINLEEWK